MADLRVVPGERGVGAEDGKGTRVTTDVARLSDREVKALASKNSCPFHGAAIATGALPVRNNAQRPLASVDDVVALGDSGGGDLGSRVLKIIAEGHRDVGPR